MEIKLDGYDFFDAIELYLKKTKGINLNFRDFDEFYAHIENHSTPNLYRYEQYQEWDDEKHEWNVINEYEVEGLYVKRKKKGSKKYTYKKMDKDCISKWACVHDDTNIELSVWGDIKESEVQ